MTKAVMGTNGRLRRCFPGPAVAIHQDRFKDTGFRKALRETLIQLEAFTPEEAYHTTKKAHSEIVEIREPVHPMFVTEMLTGILRGIGRSHDMTRIYKHTRDEVLWHNALAPWRRSPRWLLLRVALQTSLMDSATTKNPHTSYKSFMIWFMSHILRRALVASFPSETLFIIGANISRRILKLDNTDHMPWLKEVRTVMVSMQKELTKRWMTIQRSLDIGPAQHTKLLQILSVSDADLTLSTLQKYLNKIKTRKDQLSGRCQFLPRSLSRVEQNSSSLPDPTKFNKVISGEEASLTYLADTELWTQKYLDDWLKLNLETENSCSALAEVLESYTKAAV